MNSKVKFHTSYQSITMENRHSNTCSLLKLTPQTPLLREVAKDVKRAHPNHEITERTRQARYRGQERLAGSCKPAGAGRRAQRGFSPEDETTGDPAGQRRDKGIKMSCLTDRELQGNVASSRTEMDYFLNNLFPPTPNSLSSSLQINLILPALLPKAIL